MDKADDYKGDHRMFVGLRNILLLAVCLFFITGQARAAALGKIEVTSHLGETFFAELPLQLDASEKIADVSVELAALSDYQILEVFRDPAVNKLLVEIRHDARGARIVVSSTEGVDTPYFNLVLKLRHGHATNFKKYPVFLDLPEQVRPAVSAQAAVADQPAAAAPTLPVEAAQSDAGRPSVSSLTLDAMQKEKAGKTLNTQPVAKSSGPAFTPYEGWARTRRYGPMVHGDTISTVARRLPVNTRYTFSQIMVGLYNKNKDKFHENNINLINAGSYLDMPTADELAAISHRAARKLLREHENRWKQLKKQPMYAAEAEAQKNRYRPRVHVGKDASGVAAAPVKSGQIRASAAAEGMHDVQSAALPTGRIATDSVKTDAVSAQLRDLQAENLKLKQALQKSEAKAAGARPVTADAAAADEQVKKLELTVARLQRRLKLLNDQLQEVKSQDTNTLTYGLGGIIMLLIALTGYLLFLLRRDRPHPVAVTAQENTAMPQAAADMDEPASAEEPAEEMDHEPPGDSPNTEPDNADANAPTDHALIIDKDETQKAPMLESDYLAEAEVYLRYGMEDEALQQLDMAIEQQPDSLEAHSKRLSILQSHDDQAALAAAIDMARSSLNAADLSCFEAALSELGNTSTPADPVPTPAGEDTVSLDAMPEFDGAEKDVAETGQSGSEIAADDEQIKAAGEKVNAAEDTPLSNPLDDVDMGLELDMSGIEVPTLGAAPTTTTGASESPVIESESGQEGDIEFDLGDLPNSNAPDQAEQQSVGMAFESDGNTAEQGEAIPETVIETDGDGEHLDLDAMLNEFAQEDEQDTSIDETSPIGPATSDEAVPETVIDAAALGDMDLHDLLDEGDESTDDPVSEAGPENLQMDRVRSLLAEDALDEAEAALQAELDGERRGDALIGLAEVAAKRGDHSRKEELLSEAETLLNEGNREWFESVQSLPA